MIKEFKGEATNGLLRTVVRTVASAQRKPATQAVSSLTGYLMPFVDLTTFIIPQDE